MFSYLDWCDNNLFTTGLGRSHPDISPPQQIPAAFSFTLWFGRKLFSLMPYHLLALLPWWVSYWWVSSAKQLGQLIARHKPSGEHFNAILCGTIRSSVWPVEDLRLTQSHEVISHTARVCITGHSDNVNNTSYGNAYRSLICSRSFK